MPDEENIKVVVTDRPESPQSDSVLKTPHGAADITIVQLTWWQQALIRCGRVYLQSLAGILSAAGIGLASAVGVDLPANDFFKLVMAAAGMSLAPAFYSLLQNSIEILTKLDSTNPTVRA